MALKYSPSIVQDGLVLCLDPSQNKSYPVIDLPVKDGLIMWLDADDDTTFSYSSGTTVSQWRDKSGFNYHMGPKVNGPTRSVVLNSRKVLAFTAAQTIGNNTINLSTSANTVFVVSRLTGTTNGRVLTCNLDSSGNNWLLGHHGGTYNDYYAEGWVSDGGSFDTNWRMYMGDWSGTSTDLANLYSNGTAITTNSSAASQGPKYLGVNYYSNEVSTCEVAEIVVFDRVLSATERKQVHTYLGQKWGISNTDRSFIDLANTSNYFYAGTNLPRFDYYNKGSFVGSSTSNSFFQSQNLNVDFNKDWTVSIWFKHKNPSDWDFLMDYAQGGGGTLLTVYSGQLRWNYGAWFTDSVTDSPTARTYLVRDTIYNAVFQKSGTTLKTFLNGASYGSPTTNSQTLTANSTLRFGVGPSVGTDSFTGNIYACNVYSRALSATEVAQNYEAQKSKFANTIVQSGLVLNLDAGNNYSYGGAGTTFYDVSPTALSWTINNATYNSSDPKYFSYNGSNSWLQSSTSAAYDSQTITMECWCYPNSLSQNGFLFEKGQVNTQYSMFFENPNFVFRTMGSVSNQSAYFTASTYLIVSVWNHIVCTYNGSSKIMYVNGIQVQSVAASGALPTGQTDQYIGRHSSGYFFNGRIGESRVYNISLSAAQVLQNYNATKGRFGL